MGGPQAPGNSVERSNPNNQDRKISVQSQFYVAGPRCYGFGDHLRSYVELNRRLNKLNLETMACKQCDSANQRRFNGEIVIHYPGLKGLDKPLVMVFQKLSVCLRCGSTEFIVPERELRLLEPDAPPAVERRREFDL
jgi:hypothetical protein